MLIFLNGNLFGIGATRLRGIYLLSCFSRVADLGPKRLSLQVMLYFKSANVVVKNTTLLLIVIL